MKKFLTLATVISLSFMTASNAMESTVNYSMKEELEFEEAITKGNLSQVQNFLNLYGNDITEDLATGAFSIAAACEAEETSISMLKELFKNENLKTKIDRDRIGQVFNNAFEKHYSNVTKLLLAEELNYLTLEIKTVTFFSSRIRSACQNNFPEGVIIILDGLKSKKNISDLSVSAITYAAKYSSDACLEKLLATQSITYHLSSVDLTNIIQTLNDLEKSPDKEAKLQRLKAYGQSMRWCIIF